MRILANHLSSEKLGFVFWHNVVHLISQKATAVGKWLGLCCVECWIFIRYGLSYNHKGVLEFLTCTCSNLFTVEPFSVYWSTASNVFLSMAFTILLLAWVFWHVDILIASKSNSKFIDERWFHRFSRSVPRGEHVESWTCRAHHTVGPGLKQKHSVPLCRV